jgi:hypothetical protein
MWQSGSLKMHKTETRAEFQESLFLGLNGHRVYLFAGSESKTEMADGH